MKYGLIILAAGLGLALLQKQGGIAVPGLSDLAALVHSSEHKGLIYLVMLAVGGWLAFGPDKKAKAGAGKKG